MPRPDKDTDPECRRSSDTIISGVVEAKGAREAGQMVTEARAALMMHLGEDAVKAFNLKMGELAGDSQHSIDLGKFYSFLVEYMGAITPLANMVMRDVREKITAVSGIAPTSKSTQMATVVPPIAPLKTPFGGKR